MRKHVFFVFVFIFIINLYGCEMESSENVLPTYKDVKISASVMSHSSAPSLSYVPLTSSPATLTPSAPITPSVTTSIITESPIYNDPQFKIGKYVISDGTFTYYLKDYKLYKLDNAKNQESVIRAFNQSVDPFECLHNIFFDDAGYLYYYIGELDDNLNLGGSLYRYNGINEIKVLSNISNILRIDHNYIYFIDLRKNINMYTLANGKVHTVATMRNLKYPIFLFYNIKCNTVMYYSTIPDNYLYSLNYASNNYRNKYLKECSLGTDDHDHFMQYKASKDTYTTITMTDFISMKNSVYKSPIQLEKIIAATVYQNYLVLVESDEASSKLIQFSLENNQVINSISINAVYNSSAFSDGKWYICFDDYNYNSLYEYDIVNTKLRLLTKYDESFIIGDIDISGGSIWGYDCNTQDCLEYYYTFRYILNGKTDKQ